MLAFAIDELKSVNLHQLAVFLPQAIFDFFPCLKNANSTFEWRVTNESQFSLWFSAFGHVSSQSFVIFFPYKTRDNRKRGKKSTQSPEVYTPEMKWILRPVFHAARKRYKTNPGRISGWLETIKDEKSKLKDEKAGFRFPRSDLKRPAWGDFGIG